MKTLVIILLYFLFARELAPVLHSETLSSLYTGLSKVCSIVILLLACSNRRSGKFAFSFLGSIAIIAISLLYTTFFNEGDIRRVIMMMYPIWGMGGLLLWQCTSLKKTVTFIRAVFYLYLSLAIVNFLMLIYSPSFFLSTSGGVQYFLGGENHIGYPLLSGFCFALLNFYFERKRILFLLYAVIYIATILIVFSGSNVIGLAVMLLLLIPNALQKAIISLSINKLAILFVAFFSFIILLGGLISVLKTPFIVYIIEDLLGKNLTLTNRTLIWEIVVSRFFNSPIIGYGVQETMNLFYISTQYTKGYLSAHNQILQSLYEGGILYFMALIPLVRNFSKVLKQSTPFIENVFKAVFCTFLVMYMGEAPGMDKILMLILNGIVIGKVCNQKDLRSFAS